MNIESGGYPNGSVASLTRPFAEPAKPASAGVAGEDGVVDNAPDFGTFDEPFRPNVSRSAPERSTEEQE